MNTLIGIVIALIIAGFIFWAIRMLVALIPMEPIFKQVIDVILIILVVGIIIFYVVIPLLHLLVGLNITTGNFH